MAEVAIRLLGRFEITVNGLGVADGNWNRRHAATLVKLLALAPGRRLHREEVLDAVWPDEDPDTAVPKLHKAAHFARRATGRDDAIVLRNETAETRGRDKQQRSLCHGGPKCDLTRCDLSKNRPASCGRAP